MHPAGHSAVLGQTAETPVVNTFSGRVVDRLQGLLHATDEAAADLLMVNDRMFGPTPQVAGPHTGPQPPQARAELIDAMLDQLGARVSQLGALASGLNARI